MREDKLVIVASIQGRWFLSIDVSPHISPKYECDCGGTKEGLRKKGMFVGILGEGRHTIRGKKKGHPH